MQRMFCAALQRIQITLLRGGPRCDLVRTNEGLKRPYVCVVLRLLTQNVCVEHSLCA